MHYTLMAVSRDGNIDKALAPFYENLEVDPYIELTRAEATEEAKKHLTSYVDWLEQAHAEGRELYIIPWPPSPGERLDSHERRVPTEQDVIDAQVLREAGDDEAYAWYAREYAEDGLVDEEGNILSTRNPDGQWDWYAVGGRWPDMLRLEDGRRVNSAHAKDIDFSQDREAYGKALRFWEVAVEGKPLSEGEDPADFECWCSIDWLKERYLDAKCYADTMSSFSTFAVLDANGSWHGQEWCGTAEAEREWDRTFKERFIDTLEPEDVVTVVDCHV